jgi:hypothetical protein
MSLSIFLFGMQNACNIASSLWIGIFLSLVENAKEGWTKGTTYKVSDGAFGEDGWAVQGRKVERVRVIGIFL